MSIVITTKESGTKTANGWTTGSLSWTAGSRGRIALATAVSGGTPQSHTIEGGGVTWERVSVLPTIDTEYGSRRCVGYYVSDGTPSTGVITVTADTGGGTYQETEYEVAQITGLDPTTPYGTPQENDAFVTGNSLNLPSLGTINAGDVVEFAAGFENGADGFAVQAGSTEHVKITGGGNVRSFLVGHSTTDDTPGVQWNTADTYSCGIVGVILRAAEDGGGPTPPPLSNIRRRIHNYLRL